MTQPFTRRASQPLAIAATLATILLAGGCACKHRSGHGTVPHQDPYVPFGPRDIRNDSRHTAVFSNQTVLVPGVPFETRQNEYLRLADSGGRDFNLLLGPFPRLGRPAVLRARNPDVAAVIEEGFAMMMGKQPNAIFKSVRTYSSGTYYIGWVNGNDVYVFCEKSSTGHPVVAQADKGEAFAKTELSTGQYACIRNGQAISVTKYFEPGHADQILPGLAPDIVEFLTYARSRGLAAGLFKQGEYYLGRYENGIPAEELMPQ
ncbi:MAG: hypothetical protein NTV94_16420 [Planctomycetota bacterium]|nr:hypothetical protein [Planctomycetota bacterium]